MRPVVPVAARGIEVTSVGGVEGPGRASSAVDWSNSPTWAYTPNVKDGVECRARLWTTFTGALLLANAVM